MLLSCVSKRLNRLISPHTSWVDINPKGSSRPSDEIVEIADVVKTDKVPALCFIYCYGYFDALLLAQVYDLESTRTNKALVVKV